MDIRALTPQQIHDLDVATGGAFLAILHANMISGPYVDADVSVDFLGRGFRINIVFGARRDGHQGRMVTLVVEDAHKLPEAVRIGLLLLQVETFVAGMRERQKRAEVRVTAFMAERALPRGER
jgi:hypothetical protein